MSSVWWQRCYYINANLYLPIFNNSIYIKNGNMQMNKLQVDYFSCPIKADHEITVYFFLEACACSLKCKVYSNLQCISLFRGKKWLRLIYGLGLWLMINWNKNISGNWNDVNACWHSHNVLCLLFPLYKRFSALLAVLLLGTVSKSV